MNNQRGVREENEIAGVFNGYKQLNNGNLSIFIQKKDQTLLFSARFTSLSVAFRFKIIKKSDLVFGGYKAAVVIFWKKTQLIVQV